MNEQEKIQKILELVEDLKKKYTEELKAGNEEKAEEIKRVIVNTIERLEYRKNKLEKQKNIDDISGDIKDQKKAKKAFKDKSHNLNEQKKAKKFKTGTFIMTIFIFIFALISIFQKFLFDYLVHQTALSQTTNYVTLEYFIGHICIILLLISFSIFVLNSRLKSQKTIIFTTYIGLLLAYPMYGGLRVIGELTNSKILSGEGWAIIPGLILLVSCFYLYRNWYRREVKVIVE